MVGLTYLILSALLIAFLGAMGCVPREHAFTSSALYLALGLALICGLIVRREVRRDRYQFCTYWVFFGFVAGIGSLLLSFNHRVAGVVSGGVSVVTWLASIVVLIRSRMITEERPNQLLLRFSPKRVFEHAGIQIAVEAPDASGVAQGAFDMRVFVQNCWDVERRATISLHARSGLVELPGGAEIAEAKEPLVVPGGALGVLSIPVRVTTTSRLALHVALRTSGVGGRRIWRRPAQAIPMRFSPLATLLLALVSFGTFWAWGGGLSIRVPRQARRAGGGAGAPWMRRSRAHRAAGSDDSEAVKGPVEWLRTRR